MTQLTKEQRKARDGLADVHRTSPSVEQFFGSHDHQSPLYGDLILRFERVGGGVPHVYLIDSDGRTTEMEPWP